ncbi:MAG: formyltransferase family protein [Candidatus Saccharibacteria bacterium]|nr:formyltransferase family protein [Candidatus Saccharibacteria bacterium]
MTNQLKPKIIFLGQGPLADSALEILEKSYTIIFHAKTRADLEVIKDLKTKSPKLPAVLASFGVLIKQDVLNLFEPTGILNIHPSLLPKYRGPSPIESAILNGDTTFGVSVMKLVKEMDAGPIYFQKSFTFNHSTEKPEIYHHLATVAATWLSKNLNNLPTPKPQSGTPTFTTKLSTSLSLLNPEEKSALELNNQVRAFQNFPKSRYNFYNTDCIILKSHISDSSSHLSLKCSDGNFLVIDELQPAGKKPMDAKSFLNGHKSH